MSKLTATQIVAQGDYLEPDFNPASLTVSQLLGVLGFHNIPFPTPYSKPKLVALFNDKLKPQATKFKKEKIKKANSIASDDGITDGITGEPIGTSKPVRRSSRRLSRPPEDFAEPPEERPEPPKRRRSSAQPRLEATRKSRIKHSDPVLIEESEPEDQEEEVKPRKAGKSKGADTAGSVNRLQFAEDSGWESNNVFQSGAESSSPLRPSPVQPKRRKSAAPRKSRKSASAPPEMSPQPLPRFIKPESALSPRLIFKPELSDEVTKENRLIPPRPILPTRETDVTENELDAKVEQAEADDLDMVPDEDVQEEDVQEDLEDVEPAYHDYEEIVDPMTDDEVVLVQRRLSGDDSVVLVSDASDEAPSPWLRALLILAIAIFTGYSAIYRVDSKPLGYCQEGALTNQPLEDLRSQRAEISVCEQRAMEDNTVQCPSQWPLPKELLADSCTPCPEHGSCEGKSLSCETGFIPKSNPWVFFLPPRPNEISREITTSSPPADVAWLTITEVFDGLPGFGSVAFPPYCGIDEQRIAYVGSMGRQILSSLADNRGETLCSGGPGKLVYPEQEGGQARTWGINVSELKESITKNKPALASAFDDAMAKLPQHLVLHGEDQQGNRYLAHKKANLSWKCEAIVKTRQTWEEWRAYVATFVALVSYFSWLKRRRTQLSEDRKRVRELVKTVYEALQSQELAHHTDPISVPMPFLSSVQLRDLILQDEPSSTTKQRLWRKVENEVEANTNVRANMEEVSGGDEQRVWRWVGSGRITQS